MKMKQILTFLTAWGFIFLFTINSYAATGVYLDCIWNGPVELAGTSENDLNLRILGLDYLTDHLRLSGEYGFGKRTEVDLSVLFSEVKGGFLLIDGGKDRDAADVLLTISRLEIQGESDSFKCGGLCYGFDLLQSKPIEEPGAFFVEELSMGFTPQGTYEYGGISISEEAGLLFAKIKLRYQITPFLGGILGYRYYYVKLTSDYARFQGFTLGMSYQF